MGWDEGAAPGEAAPPTPHPLTTGSPQGTDPVQALTRAHFCCSNSLFFPTAFSPAFRSVASRRGSPLPSNRTAWTPHAHVGAGMGGGRGRRKARAGVRGSGPGTPHPQPHLQPLLGQLQVRRSTLCCAFPPPPNSGTGSLGRLSPPRLPGGPELAGPKLGLEKGMCGDRRILRGFCFFSDLSFVVCFTLCCSFISNLSSEQFQLWGCERPKTNIGWLWLREDTYFQ